MKHACILYVFAMIGIDRSIPARIISTWIIYLAIGCRVDRPYSQKSKHMHIVVHCGAGYSPQI